MMRSSSSAYVLIAAAMLFVVAAAAPVRASADNAAQTCRVESPVDGSFWIGTADDGLFRLGRNGRTIRYTAEGGQLGSNTIVSLIFDNNKNLWILDGSGTFRVFSSVKGFQKVSNLPDGIVAASIGVSEGTILFATVGALYSLDVHSGDKKMIAELQLTPHTIAISQDGNEIWLFADNGVMKVAPDGSEIIWEEAGAVLNLLPFTFETNTSPKVPNAGFYFPIWLFVLLYILALLAGGLTLYFFFLRKTISIEEIPEKSNSSDNTSASESIDILSRIVRTPSVTSSNASDNFSADVNSSRNTTGEFTKRVNDLVKEHIGDPNFGVVAIASMTGLSRIHVNRKLRAEGSPSPSSLIRDARMSLASDLLKRGDLSIAQVSAECGFRTPSYFATAFKDYYGISPSDFLLFNK